MTVKEFLDTHAVAQRGAKMLFSEFREHLQQATPGVKWSNRRISQDLKSLGVRVEPRTNNVTYVFGLVWAKDRIEVNRAFDRAVDAVDEEFGFGSAIACPKLVAEFLARTRPVRSQEWEPDALTVAVSVIRLMRERKQWRGTASDLARAVEIPHLRDFRRAWPLISECRELLAECGINALCLKAKYSTASRQLLFSRAA